MQNNELILNITLILIIVAFMSVSLYFTIKSLKKPSCCKSASLKELRKAVKK